MSDNNINHDPNDPKNGDTRSGKHEKDGPDSHNSGNPDDQRSAGDEISARNDNQSEENKTEQKNDTEENASIKISPEQPEDIVISKKTLPEDTIIEGNAKEPPVSSVAENMKPKSKESNYQISLIDENLLRVVVSTGRAVKIDSIVREVKGAAESQSNEINLHPRIDYSIQEVEVLIAIEEITNTDTVSETQPVFDEPGSDLVRQESHESEEAEPNEPSKSNYQLNLINENLLKIKIITNKSVRIESAARDKRNQTQIQNNKTILKPKTENSLQQIEITMAIEAAPAYERGLPNGEGKSSLIPNPDVVDLIRPPDYSSLLRGGNEFQSEDKNGYQNPFDSLRQLIKKNLTIGIIAAIVLHTAGAALAFYTISKKTNAASPEEPTRLIVLQDLPDPKIKLEDVEDPNKPKIEETVVPPEKTAEPKREISPRRTVKPPVVTRPKKQREDTKLDSSVEANLNRELDSLRKLADETATPDTTAADTTRSDFEIADSLQNNFSENDIGLVMNYPKNWKLTDQRDINKNEKNFKGVVLTDTVAEQPGTMTMFIFLDNENKDYNAEDFKAEFKMNDSSLNAFSKEPKTLAGFTEYRFYVFNKLGTEKLSLRASVRKQFFDQYKNEIEAVVRSIRIRKKEDL